ncbi:hypothetical protein KC799_03055 [candidate division KSB1 bacterium]|nr:hypothetical protein [candidate division KSB1 bacterium]
MDSPVKVELLQNALDSLQRIQRGLKEMKSGNPLALKDVLTWAWHCVELMANSRLQPGRKNFDAWMQDFLRDTDYDLSVDRDIHWSETAHLNLLELLDIFSDVKLPILKPEFYQGWQDRTSRCHNLRTEVGNIIGKSLDAVLRDRLMLLLAVYNRLVHIPAPVHLEMKKVEDALPALFDFIEMLLDKGSTESLTLQNAIKECRLALG